MVRWETLSRQRRHIRLPGCRDRPQHKKNAIADSILSTTIHRMCSVKNNHLSYSRVKSNLTIRANCIIAMRAICSVNGKKVRIIKEKYIIKQSTCVLFRNADNCCFPTFSTLKLPYPPYLTTATFTRSPERWVANNTILWERWYASRKTIYDNKYPRDPGRGSTKNFHTAGQINTRRDLVC